jgi:hypothetical protein
MKLSKKSNLLMSFFTKNKYINHIEQTHRTDKIITILYHDILNAYNFLLNLKQTRGTRFYNVNIKKIHSSSQIIRPNNFNTYSFPEQVRKHIDQLSLTELCYTFSLFNRNIKLYFTTEDDHIELKLEEYNKHVDSIIMWLYILNEYASKQCSENLIVYFYFTSLEKRLPNSNIHILDENNINTAFTTTCPKDSEIVVYRKEEWFKVFIHESFHNFALDFSDMNNAECTSRILAIFPVQSDVNLYESYTEFWAEMINALFCSFFSLKDKNNVDEFLSNSEFFINFERTYSFFQLAKALRFMGLSYTDLYSKNIHRKVLRETMYKEKTNVLSYYVIKTILLNNYQDFLFWCTKHNLSLLQFKKTIKNQTEYCNFIEKNYKKSSMIEGVEESQKFLNILYSKNKNRREINDSYVLSNLRMSICELG